MSKADEMFEELGYEKFQHQNVGYMRRDNEGRLTGVIFFLDKKSIGVHYTEVETIGITMQELQAINEKVKELGWK